MTGDSPSFDHYYFVLVVVLDSNYNKKNKYNVKHSDLIARG